MNAMTRPPEVEPPAPGRGRALLDRVGGTVPRYFGRRRVASLGAGVLLGLVAGLLAPDAATTASDGTGTAPDETNPDPLQEAPALGMPFSVTPTTSLLGPEDLTALGENTSAGTYTVGSVSTLPLACAISASGPPQATPLPPAPSGEQVPLPPEAGLNSRPGQTVAVTFGLDGASMTQSVTEIGSIPAGAAQLRGLAALAEDCANATDVSVQVGDLSTAEGLGDEYLVLDVTQNDPGSGTRTTRVALVRVEATALEFSLTGSDERSPDLTWLLDIARAGVQASLAAREQSGAALQATSKDMGRRYGGE